MLDKFDKALAVYSGTFRSLFRILRYEVESADINTYPHLEPRRGNFHSAFVVYYNCVAMYHPTVVRLLRKLIAALSVILVLIVVGCLSVYAAARLFQYRAENLSVRVRALTIGESAFDDVRKLSKEYSREVLPDGGKCSSESCGFTIRLTNLKFPVFYDAPVMWKFGIRPTIAVATIRVSNGKLRYASYGLFTRTQYGWWLKAEFHAAPSLSMFDKCSHDYLGRDSTYAVTGGHLTNGDGGGSFRRTAFGIGATAEQIRKATAIRFSCITAVPSCRTIGDLMPDAKKDLSFEPHSDPLFTKDCEAYVKQVEVGNGPWDLETAFAPDPVSVSTWILTRSEH